MNALVPGPHCAVFDGSQQPEVGDVSASAWLKPILEGAPARLTRIAGQSGRYGYYLLEPTRRVVAIEAPGGLDLPIGITAPTYEVARVNQSSTVIIGGGRLEYDNGALRCLKYRADRPELTATEMQLASAAQILDVEIARWGPPDVPVTVLHRIDALACAIARSPVAELSAALERVIGLGPGSTPAGDDAVCGAVATMAALGRGRGPIAAWSRCVVDEISHALVGMLPSTTPLSAELLECAMRGFMLPRLADCIVLALQGRCIRRAMDDLRRVGHDSGYFLATGAAISLRVAATIQRSEKRDARPN